MSFFFSDTEKQPKNKTKQLSKHGCIACPLKSKSVINPKLVAEGSSNPEIYALLSTPKQINTQDALYSDEMSQFFLVNLRKIYTSDYISQSVRWNYAVPCPSKEPFPSPFEIECCKIRLFEDIEKTKPKIILGVGDIAIQMFLGKGKTTNLRGRTIPIKVGRHVCWYLPIYDIDSFTERQKIERGMVFLQDVKMSKTLLETEQEPEFVSGGYDNGVGIFMGRTVEDLQENLTYFLKQPLIAVDIENYPLKPVGKERCLATVAISDFERTLAFPVEYPGAWSAKQLVEVKQLLRYFLLRSGTKICHNLPHELEWFHVYFGQDVFWKTQWADTMAQAYVIDERIGNINDSTLSLGRLTTFNFGFNVKKLSDVNLKDCRKTPLPDLLVYNGMDAKWTYALFKKQEPNIAKKQTYVYNHLVDLEKTVTLSSIVGVPVSIDELNKQNNELTKVLTKAEEKIQQLQEVAGFKKLKKTNEFKPGSSAQIGYVLKNILKLPQIKVTKGNSYSTDEEVLNTFAEKGVEFAKHIVEYREVSHIKSTYLDGILKLLDENNLLHTTFNCLLTSTGRISSKEPNLQNMPKRKFKEIRRIVQALKDCWILSLDYAQIEARVIAMASQDKVFMDSIWSGYDIHEAWAKRIYVLTGREFEDKKELKEFRSIVKNKLVFPLFFGASKASIRKAFDLSETVANKLFNEFWDMFSGVKKWQQELERFYKKYGYVETLTGRRRHAPLTINEMYNSPIQGTAADIVTDAMKRLAKYAYTSKKSYYHPVLNIHDDLTFFIPDSELDEAVPFIAKEMCKPVFDFINVPLAIEASLGKNWCDQEEIGKWSSEQFKY